MSVAFLSHPDCGLHDTGWEHPEHVGRLRAIPSALKYHPDLFHALQHVEGRHATPDELALAHDAAYIARVESLAASGGGRLDPDTVVSSGSWLAATAAAGCVLDAVDRVLSGESTRAFCAVRPPGHHALRDRGMGFCLFGNVALGALYALAQHGLERVLIVDWDVHHGNGTQALVQHDARIRFVSMHQWPWYPGTGAADERGPHHTLWNVPMAPGLAPAVYTAALWRAIDDATRDFTPELVFVSAGFDSLAGDPLGEFTWSAADLASIMRTLIERARVWCDGRVIAALEGGYAPEATAEAVMAQLHVMVEA
jgi:acetoin utilization deacetylase AcuC-like enzyme